MSPKIGNKYHCYCACGGCENFEHCFKGECDAPSPMDRAESLARKANEAIQRAISDEDKAILTGYRSLPKPGDVRMLQDGSMKWVSPFPVTLPLDDCMPGMHFIGMVPPTEVKPVDLPKYPGTLPQYDFSYIPMDQDGNVYATVPAKNPPTWAVPNPEPDSDESPEPRTRAQRIEDMIDWMEDNGIELEAWQANAFRAILMSDSKFELRYRR